MARIINNLRPGETGYVEFDYPDYGGLPKKIYSRLTSDQVDLIQQEVQFCDREFDDMVLAKILAKGA